MLRKDGRVSVSFLYTNCEIVFICSKVMMLRGFGSFKWYSGLMTMLCMTIKCHCAAKCAYCVCTSHAGILYFSLGILYFSLGILYDTVLLIGDTVLLIEDTVLLIGDTVLLIGDTVLLIGDTVLLIGDTVLTHTLPYITVLSVLFHSVQNS